MSSPHFPSSSGTQHPVTSPPHGLRVPHVSRKCPFAPGNYTVKWVKLRGQFGGEKLLFLMSCIVCFTTHRLKPSSRKDGPYRLCTPVQHSLASLPSGVPTSPKQLPTRFPRSYHYQNLCERNRGTQTSTASEEGVLHFLRKWSGGSAHDTALPNLTLIPRLSHNIHVEMSKTCRNTCDGGPYRGWVYLYNTLS